MVQEHEETEIEFAGTARDRPRSELAGGVFALITG